MDEPRDQLSSAARCPLTVRAAPKWWCSARARRRCRARSWRSRRSVGEDRSEAVPVVVGEEQLRAGVRALTADDHARPRRPACEVKVDGDLCDLPVGALGAVRVKC